MSLQVGTATISAMDLRKETGALLDRVDYRGERFIVERSGKPKAVLIPLSEYEQLERQRREARERFWIQTQEIRKAFANEDPQKVEALIQEAIDTSRSSSS
ncbi:MAG: type II toxin-antitoxin system prevent-host-death family antitoxin [Anaerolineae bacterium]|nr:type II toxin-antitoxin system prevent-host-death family antitoxin [Anaerolineae bacterium]